VVCARQRLRRSDPGLLVFARVTGLGLGSLVVETRRPGVCARLLAVHVTGEVVGMPCGFA
jgi:hypothetical protein